MKHFRLGDRLLEDDGIEFNKDDFDCDCDNNVVLETSSLSLSSLFMRFMILV